MLSTPRYESQLNREARQVALVFMRDFERSGIHLPEAERTRFVQLSDEILVLGRQFLQEVSSGEGREEVELPVDWLEGMAPAFAGALRGGVDSSASPSADGQKLRLFPNSWELQTVSKFAPDERARKLAYLVANSGSRGQIETLERLLQARAELANLVGHKSYAEMTLDDKMARTPGEFAA